MKPNRFKTYILPFLVLSFLVLSACNKDLKQGQTSLRGIWKVTEIQSVYANYIINDNEVVGQDQSETITNTGSLGHFNFSETKVAYNFNRNDTVFSGNGDWELNLEKVNEGFFKVNKWKLSIDQDYIFDLHFEDETKNAEKKATSIVIDHYPSKSGFGVAYFIKLEKQ